MNIKLDLSKFQHVCSDDKCTTLRHEDGHELKIAHNSLSPKFREQLEAVQKFADGGSTTKPKKTGSPNSVPVTDASPYDQTLSNGWNNIKKAFNGEAEGGMMADGGKVSDEAHETTVRPDSGFGKVILMDAEGGGVEAEGTRPKRHSAEHVIKPDTGHGKIIMVIPPPVKVGKVIKKADGGEITPHNMPDGFMNYAEGTDDVQGPQVEQSNAPEPEQQEQSNAPEQQDASAAPQSQPDPVNQEQQPAAAPQDDQSNAGPQPQPPVSPQTAAALPQPPTTPFEQHKNDVQNELMHQGLAFQSDITNGHIDAPSMEKMFADKSTLGKIGTLFALVVGGAGSGLSHQPNLAFQAMQNQLDRDFKAQMQSAENAQNYFRLNQQNLANQAGINQTKTETAIKAAAAARIQGNWVALDKLTKENAKLPEGSPARQAGDQVLALLNDQVQKGNYSIASQAATAAATARALGIGNGSNGANSSASQISNMKLLGPQGQQRAAELEQKTISGVPSVAGQIATRPINENDRKEITAMKTLDDKGKDLFNFINSHKDVNLNRWSPQTRAVAQQKVEELKNFYNDSIKGGALTEGRLGWYDKQFGKGAPTDVLPQIMGQTNRLKEMIDSNHTRMNTNLESMGFRPKNTASGAQQANDQYKQQKAMNSSKNTQPSEEVRMVNGRAAVFNPNTKQFIRWK